MLGEFELGGFDLGLRAFDLVFGGFEGFGDAVALLLERGERGLGGAHGAREFFFFCRVLDALFGEAFLFGGLGGAFAFAFALGVFFGVRFGFGFRVPIGFAGRGGGFVFGGLGGS